MFSHQSTSAASEPMADHLDSLRPNNINLVFDNRKTHYRPGKRLEEDAVRTGVQRYELRRNHEVFK